MQQREELEVYIHSRTTGTSSTLSAFDVQWPGDVSVSLDIYVDMESTYLSLIYPFLYSYIDLSGTSISPPLSLEVRSIHRRRLIEEERER